MTVITKRIAYGEQRGNSTLILYVLITARMGACFREISSNDICAMSILAEKARLMTVNAMFAMCRTIEHDELCKMSLEVLILVHYELRN